MSFVVCPGGVPPRDFKPGAGPLRMGQGFSSAFFAVMLCKSRSIASRHPACFVLASLPCPLPLPEMPLVFRSSRAGWAAKTSSLGNPVEWGGAVKPSHTLGAWYTLGSGATLKSWGALGTCGTLKSWGALGTCMWNFRTSCCFRNARIVTLQSFTLTSRQIQRKQGGWVDQRVCCHRLGLRIGFLQRNIIWIIRIMVSGSAITASWDVRSVRNKRPAASLRSEGRGGEGVIEAIVPATHAYIHPLPGFTRQSALSHAPHNHRCWSSLSSAWISEGTSELSSSKSFMNTWLLAWDLHRYVPVTWDSLLFVRAFEDNVGDHPFTSSISDAASMRNHVAKHGGSALPTHTSACCTHCGSICNANAKGGRDPFHCVCKMA